MKTAGDIVSVLFDEKFMKKAQEQSSLFKYWSEVMAKHDIAAASDHSRIKDLKNGILLVETDHPGWKQILQTKQDKILNDFRSRFPNLDISGISLMLGNYEPIEENIKNTETVTEIKSDTEKPKKEPIQTIQSKGFDAIKDKEFREKLIKLGELIESEEGGFEEKQI